MIQTDLDKASYSLGMNIGTSLKGEGVTEINAELFAKGLNDMMKGNQLELSLQEAYETIQEFLAKANAKKYEKNITEGKKFLEENAKRAGVVTLPSGLQYEILKEGNGPKPTKEQTAVVKYEGKTVDGKVFDSNWDKEEPAEMPVASVIPGFSEALQLMPAGSEWEIYIPQDMAYGVNAQGSIEAFSTLIFKVKLIEVK